MIDQPEILKIDDPLGDTSRALDWLRDHATPAQMQLTVAKDQAISQALAAIQPLWTREEIGRRCVLVRAIGHQGETLFVDGIAVLVLDPPQTTQEWKADSLVLTITQKFKRVRAVSL
jgi:hypothetical protein